MKKNNVWQVLLVGVLALMSNSVWGNHTLPNQPLAADGKSYVVQWDCENSTWYASNNMEYDQTFVVAFDLTGTALLTWLQGKPAVQGMVRAVALNVMRDDQGNEYADRTARMWRIRDNIYGAEVNYKQWAMKNGSANNAPAKGKSTKIYARIFGVENGFGGKCNLPYIDGKSGKWYQWPNGWNEDYVMPNGSGCCFFTFAPYTGTKTEPIFRTQDKTGLPDIYYDKDHYVLCDGYAAPCMIQPTPDDDNCCPELEDLPATLSIDQGADTMVVLNFLTRKSGDYTFLWYWRKPGGSWAVYTGSTTESLTIPTKAVGTQEYKCKVTSLICPEGVESSVMTVTVNKVPICPGFSWTVDNEYYSEDTRMYPGGYYQISCYCKAGRPTITVTGNNVYSVRKSAGGNATNVEVTLLGNASGDITIEFESTVENEDYKACKETVVIPVGDCENGLAYTMQGFNGNGKYVIADDGKVILGNAVTDKTDMWQPIATGEQVDGNDVFYLRNVGTGEYLYRGPVQDTKNDNIDFAEPLTSPKNGMTADYKWFFHREGGDKRYIYLMNVAGWTGNWQNSFALHNRGWKDKYCNGGNEPKYELRICDPEMKVGELTGYSGSNEMRMENDPYNTNNWQLKEVYGAPEHFQTTIGWNGTAPVSPVELTIGGTCTNTIKRTDALHSINKVITYTSSDPNIATVDATTGQVTAVGSGTATITAKLEDVGCFDGDSISYQVKVKGCSEFTWSIDEEPGLSKLMYPGGWYIIHCTNEDGAPDITVSGTGITSETPTKSGNTTSVKVIVTGNAVAGSEMTLKASLNVGFTCENEQTVTISECTETSAESRKIEWFNFNGSTPFPQYWIHGGASVFLRDNNGKLEADIEHSDGNDQWYIIYTSEMCQGQKVFYLQNVQTMRYVYRGSVHGNQGGDWEYAEALLSENNLQTNDFKWVLYAHGNDTAIVNIDGFTGSNLTNGAYVLHVRNWEAPGLFSNPNIPSPRMVCGKMADQGGSPAFYFKGYTTTKPITQFQTAVAWQGTAPADTITSQQGNQFGYTISRTDQLHSINAAITYRSTNTNIATVDAATGQVTVVAADGECDIEAILESVGCFNGDTLRYHVRLYDCTRDITTHKDYLLPKQPKADDCSYIVKWDCATGTWATENDMEWGETFVFAINLAGTPLGDWVMQGSGRAGVVRSVAFDRFQGKHNPDVDNIGQQLNLDASRLWHIRDTIFGATFNFSQIPFNDNPSHFYTPAMDEQTEISARLFGFETAVGEACDKTFAAPAGKWWEWSNAGTTQNQWKGQWLENSYVSGNDMYLFRFAPYTGKSDPEIKAADDDSRDQWYDNHYFDRKGYHSPCPQEWPIDQTLSLDKTTICDKDGETATLTMAASETTCSYVLYKDGTAVGGSEQVGTGSALTWTIEAAGTYSVQALSSVEGHDAMMGQCNNTGSQVVTVHCDEPLPTYLKFDDNNGTHVWSDVKNWWPEYNRLPNETDSAVIAAPCQVDIQNARTYYLTFTVASGYDVTVLPTGGLTIVGEITNAKQGDILIKSDKTGNGSFVYKNPTTPYPAKVEFYSPAKDGQTDAPTWQYVGQPLATSLAYGSTYTQPGTQIYIWDTQSDHSMGGLWYKVATSYAFDPFKGFCLTQQQPTTYTYTGTLNAAESKPLTVPYLAAEDYPSFYLLSNSWTAPIRIADMATEDFDGVDATIYIMNTGTYEQAKAQQGAVSTIGQAKQKGQYNAIPVHASSYLSDALKVIPSMQGFFVHHDPASQAAGSVTLNYAASVYSDNFSLSNESARTPQRKLGRAADIEAMHLTVENVYWGDAVDLLQGELFTENFDNGWDGRKMKGQNTPINLSVQTAGGEMSVAALSDWTWVPLTFGGIRGLDFTFTATMNHDTDLYLYDQATNTYTALTDGATYTFTANSNVENSRFYICKGWQKAPEGTNDIDGKYIINGHLIIIRNGVMHTALGMQLR
ncbi:MAG: Ig-like domain-containing protein [Paludibacteraceae bacterium]|nr:Ig-like domain-containing protein [Paludibacteraceae bacterium]